MLRVREMRVDDIDAVYEIETACFPSPWSKESFEKELTANELAHYYVVAVDGEIAAYGGFWAVLEEAHITNIACKPSYQGNGYGEAVTLGLISHAKVLELERVTLEVRVSNEKAKRLYHKLGFKDVGIRPKYYSDNQEDALIMWKEIEV